MTNVKICGLSTPEAVATAVEAGADYIGFVFAKSKRQVSLEQAHELAKGVTGQTKIVGVFVSPSLEELEEAISQVPLDIVQIHGTFDEALISKISVPVIRAIQISDSESQVKSQSDYLLFDAPIAGSGQTFDWQLLADKQIEQEKRGIYAGAIGYLSATGDMDFAIAIRTMILKNQKAYVQAGAGVVYDSVPENEFYETINKAKAMTRIGDAQ